MTNGLPGRIKLRQRFPDDIADNTVIGGSSYLDQGSMAVRLAIKDYAGVRAIRQREGDVFEFAGTTWRVTHIAAVAEGERSHSATI